MSNIGKLIEVEVRELWKHEQYDFSNWLAKEENLKYLNDITGLTLTEADTEVYVGSYRCDIVAKDENSNTTIIIENQLEQTNHDHLGKIITYASGLDAQVIIWIVKEATEPHRAAIEWLNNNTNGNINFFLIEIHAYKIGDSIPAPKFEVIEKPNDFIKNKKVNRSDAECLLFWQQFNIILANVGKPFKIKKANIGPYYNISMGTSEAIVSIGLVNKGGYINVELYIWNNKILFDKLFNKKDAIENELKMTLVWERLDEKKASRIRYQINGLNFDNHDNYEALMKETINTAANFRDTFKKYIFTD